MTLIDTLRRLDYGQLPISDYSRQYMLKLLPELDYRFDIYHRVIDRVVAATGGHADKMTLVDYGGGHGYLSLAAKERGVGRVVYVDINPQAAEAVDAVSHAVGYSPDVIITGDTSTLRRWCTETSILPHALVGMDVIEHIYRLDTFFADLFAIHPTMPMVFTTGSNPCNPIVVGRLHRIMEEDERDYCQQRHRFLQHHLGKEGEADVRRLAQGTRGLTNGDSLAYVRSGAPLPYPLAGDPCNTCDPATGNWTERLLPLEDYRSLLSPFGATLHVANGYYNAYRRGTKGLLSRMANRLLPLDHGYHLAPFIFLEVNL